MEKNVDEAKRVEVLRLYSVDEVEGVSNGRNSRN